MLHIQVLIDMFVWNLLFISEAVLVWAVNCEHLDEQDLRRDWRGSGCLSFFFSLALLPVCWSLVYNLSFFTHVELFFLYQNLLCCSYLFVKLLVNTWLNYVEWLACRGRNFNWICLWEQVSHWIPNFPIFRFFTELVAFFKYFNRISYIKNNHLCFLFIFFLFLSQHNIAQYDPHLKADLFFFHLYFWSTFFFNEKEKYPC